MRPDTVPDAPDALCPCCGRAPQLRRPADVRRRQQGAKVIIEGQVGRMEVR